MNEIETQIAEAVALIIEERRERRGAAAFSAVGGPKPATPQEIASECEFMRRVLEDIEDGTSIGEVRDAIQSLIMRA